MKISQETKDITRFFISLRGIFIMIILVIIFISINKVLIKFDQVYRVLGILIAFIGSLSISLIIPNLIMKHIILFKISKYKKENNPQVAIIIGYDTWRGLFVSSYLGVDYLIKAINQRGLNSKLYIRPTKREFNNIIKDSNIRILYLVGHGSKRGFSLNKKESIYYSDYANSNIVKDEINLYHCGHREGKNIIDYLVKKENRKKCFSANNKVMVISYVIRFYDLYKQESKKKGAKRGAQNN
ncbi:hypothetical protein J4423_05700 [Candidatus Pacearchaeota archaeon]|nr:hypothetical protein [Candidatus Pacearchaeota archaeon]